MIGVKKSPLKRKAALQSYRPLKTSQQKKHRSSRARAKEFSPKIRQIVKERCHGMCERCGSRPAVHLHHAVYRSQQGTGELDNAIALCMGCHAEAHFNREVREWCIGEAKRLLTRGE